MTEFFRMGRSLHPSPILYSVYIYLFVAASVFAEAVLSRQGCQLNCL